MQIFVLGFNQGFLSSVKVISVLEIFSTKEEEEVSAVVKSWVEFKNIQMLILFSPRKHL